MITTLMINGIKHRELAAGDGKQINKRMRVQMVVVVIGLITLAVLIVVLGAINISSREDELENIR